MTGFFSAVVGELLTGRGVIGQLNLETSLSPYIIKALIAAIVGFNLFTALLPGGTFSEENQQDVKKRPAGEHIQCCLNLISICNTTLPQIKNSWH